MAGEVEGEDQATRRRGVVGATGGCHGRRRDGGEALKQRWLGKLGTWDPSGNGVMPLMASRRLFAVTVSWGDPPGLGCPRVV